VGVAR